MPSNELIDLQYRLTDAQPTTPLECRNIKTLNLATSKPVLVCWKVNVYFSANCRGISKGSKQCQLHCNFSDAITQHQYSKCIPGTTQGHDH